MGAAWAERPALRPLVARPRRRSARASATRGAPFRKMWTLRRAIRWDIMRAMAAEVLNTRTSLTRRSLTLGRGAPEFRPRRLI